MKFNLHHILGAAMLAMPFIASAQAETAVDFNAGTGYKSLGVYDTWPESPFRTGELTGNWGIVSTAGLPLTNDFTAPEKALGAQRSRFGSNTFGVRIDLETPFELTPTRKYIHVVMNRPVSGRVMLIGIGPSNDFPQNGDQIEQFWEVSRNNVKPDQWTDAVFAVKGSGRIFIKSLVVVPECESPHNSTEDFAFYVASVVVNNSSSPVINAENYPIAAGSREDNITLSRSDRYTNTITFTSPSDGEQTIALNQQSNKKLYHFISDAPVTAKAGEEINVNIGYSATTWMHTYAYADWNNDGKFDTALSADGTPAPGAEFVAFSYNEGKNSKGQNAPQGSSVALPSFKIPADIKPGIYRMRFKVDWDCIDPAGNDDAGNQIVSNGGVIADVLLNVHTDNITVNDFQLNGEVLAADGSKLNAFPAKFGEDFKIKMNPEKGFTHRGVTVRYGYLEGDSVIMENPQYFSKELPFKTDDYTIPGQYMRGNVLILGKMLEESSVTSDPADVYGLNFPRDLKVTRTDRQLNSLSLTGSEDASADYTFDANPSPVYKSKVDDEPLKVVPGENIDVAVNYLGRAMHLYMFVDWNDNEAFDNTLDASGLPAGDKELVSYTCYNSKNSLGAAVNAPGSVPVNTMPSFQVPANVKKGRYFARFKIDWNNIDPKGQYYEGQGNKINDNGGYIVDFVIEVTADGEGGDEPAQPTFGQPAEFKVTTITDGKFDPATQWYAITNGQDHAPLGHDATADHIALPAGASLNSADTHLWCVTGNAASGYQIYNKAAGTSMMLASPAEMKGTTGGSSFAIVKAPGDATHVYNWTIIPSTDLSSTGYYIGHHGSDTNFLNSRDNKLAFWTGGKDHGSTFQFIPVATTAIEGVTIDAAPAVKGIYDLAGRRLPDDARLAPGLYIIDGRKTFVK